MSASGTIQSTELHLPHRVTRKLLRGRWRRRARNVLVIANHCADLVQLLNRRGINAVGIDDESGDRKQDAANVHFGSVAGAFPFEPHRFDLALVGNCRAFHGGLSGPEPLIAMANVLSSLKSRSRLVWVQPVLSDASADDTEQGLAEINAELSPFPGSVTVGNYHDGWERFLSLEWLMGRHRNVQLRLTTLTVPVKPISRLSWHEHAREAAMRQMQAEQQERAA